MARSFVEGSLGRDEGDQSARPDPFNRRSEKIIVDWKFVGIEFEVVRLVVAERDI
jgi:hypothetical protein